MIRHLLLLAVSASPLLGTSRQFADRPLSVEALTALETDFGSRRETSTTKDHPYGKDFRFVYVLKDAQVTAYSGIYDGWHLEWRTKPLTLDEALRLIKAKARAQDATSALGIDFAHPDRKGRTITYHTKGDGCQAAYVLHLNPYGRVVEIDDQGAC